MESTILFDIGTLLKNILHRALVMGDISILYQYRLIFVNIEKYRYIFQNSIFRYDISCDLNWLNLTYTGGLWLLFISLDSFFNEYWLFHYLLWLATYSKPHVCGWENPTLL